MEQSSSSWLALSCGSAAALWAGGRGRDSKAPPQPSTLQYCEPSSKPLQTAGQHRAPHSTHCFHTAIFKQNILQNSF